MRSISRDRDKEVDDDDLLSSERPLSIPVDKIQALGDFPTSNPIQFEDSEGGSNNINSTVGTEKFEIIITFKEKKSGEIEVVLNEEDEIEIIVDGEHLITTPKIPHTCDASTVAYRYNANTGILVIEGKMRTKRKIPVHNG